jgi:hypothetical protein
LNGAYAFTITGRQVSTAETSAIARSHITTAGTLTNVFQANGSATFNGLSTVTITLSAGTNQTVSSPLTWSGTYSVQSNCAGVINITTGGSATLNLAIFQATQNPATFNFLVSGSDATYSYSGNGNTQPVLCSAGTFSGVYTFSATGFALTAGAVSGAENGTGLLQFDGVSQVIANISMATLGAAPSALTLTGSYSISSSCMGSATLTDASANSYTMSFSIYNATVANAASYVGFAQSSKFLVGGNVHATYGQPVPTAVVQRPDATPALAAKAISANRGGRA